MLRLKKQYPRLQVLEIISIALLLIWMIPLLIIFINAGKSYNDVISNPLSLSVSFQNYYDNTVAVFTDRNTDFINAFVDSILVTSLSLIFMVICSALQAWVLVRRKHHWTNILFYIYVSAMVIPFQVIMYPLVYFFRNLGEIIHIKLLDSYSGIVLAYLGLGCPLSVFIFHGFIKNIPLALEESATIDGCPQSKVFFSIVFPLLRPVCYTIVILQGIWIWNDYLLPVMLLGTNGQIRTIPIAIKMFAGTYIKQWNLILSATATTMLPVIILFIFAQKFIIKGVVEGALK